MERYYIYTSSNLPTVQFIYINGLHKTDSWINEVNLPMLKINMFIKGQCYIIVNGTPYLTSPGDILIYRPHDIHYGKIPYEQNIEYYEILFDSATLRCLCGGDELIQYFERQNPEESLSNKVIIHLADEVYHKLSKEFNQLMICLRNPPPAGNLVALSMLISILYNISTINIQSQRKHTPVVYPNTLTLALSYINQHLTEKISNYMISNACEISPSYLNRLFQRFLHCTPHEYVLSCRINLARNLLTQGMSVTDTCYQSGFQDCSSFSVIFKKNMGILPSVYRKNALVSDC